MQNSIRFIEKVVVNIQNAMAKLMVQQAPLWCAQSSYLGNIVAQLLESVHVIPE